MTCKLTLELTFTFTGFNVSTQCAVIILSLTFSVIYIFFGGIFLDSLKGECLQMFFIFMYTFLMIYCSVCICILKNGIYFILLLYGLSLHDLNLTTVICFYKVFFKCMKCGTFTKAVALVVSFCYNIMTLSFN